MAIKQISELVELTTLADGDMFIINDISESLPINKTKRIIASNVLASKITKPTNPSTTSIVQMSTDGVPALRSIKQTVQIQILSEQDQVDTVSGVGYFFIPSTLNGMNLVRAQAMTLVSGSDGATTIQIINLTKYPANPALTTAISIASGGTIGTAGTINSAYDDVSTDDKIKIYVTANSSTKPSGLIVVLEYQLP